MYYDRLLALTGLLGVVSDGVDCVIGFAGSTLGEGGLRVARRTAGVVSMGEDQEEDVFEPVVEKEE